MALVKKAISDAKGVLDKINAEAKEIGGEFKKGVNIIAADGLKDLEGLAKDLGLGKGEEYLREKRHKKEMNSTDKLHEKAFLKVKHILEDFSAKLEKWGKKCQVNVEHMLDALVDAISDISKALGISESTEHRKNASKPRVRGAGLDF